MDLGSPARLSEYCSEMANWAVKKLSGTYGAIFGFDGLSGLWLVAQGGRVPDRSGVDGLTASLLADAAQRALQGSRPVLIPTSPEYSTIDDGVGDCVAIPLWLDGSVVGVLAVSSSEKVPWALEECVSQLAVVALPLALAVDRVRIHAALEDRANEIGDLRRQLDAYAVDFRSTYLSERARSDELSAALAELETTYRATVHGLAVAVEAKDEVTGGHLQRVSRYGMALTRLIAPDHGEDVQFQYGFLLHDIGKLTVPDGVLTKAGPLSEDEWEVIRLHPESGRSILEGIPFLEGAREIVYAHHERWDGRGYPRGLAGEEIPLGARIFPLCDAFDAMTSDRPYRSALSIGVALEELRRGSGSQFWPDAVDAFVSLPADDIEALRGISEGRPG